MYGGIDSQVTHIFNDSGILEIGKSKHQAKELARANEAKTWHEVGKYLGIYSYGTADTYKDVWHEFARFAKSELRLKDMEKTGSEHVGAFLFQKIEDGIARSTYQKISAAMEKFEMALNRYSQKFGKGNLYDFDKTIRAASKEAQAELEKGGTPRAYEKPTEVINRLERDSHQLVASIQHQGGARISEATWIKEHQLKGVEEGRGVIFLDFTKGGKEREMRIDPETYNQLEKAISDMYEFKVDKGGYRVALRIASEATGQKYQGSHGLRWSFAQERMETLQVNGRTYEEALVMVSNEMGHNRADITNHYLRK
jgi:integrase